MAAFGNQLQPWEENQISTCDPLESSFHLFTSDRTLPLATAQTASALKRRHPPSPMTATALHDSSSLLAETLGLPQPAFRRTDTDGGGTPRSGAQPPNDPDMSNPMRRAAERPLDTVRRMSKVVDLTPVGVFHDVIWPNAPHVEDTCETPSHSSQTSKRTSIRKRPSPMYRAVQSVPVSPVTTKKRITSSAHSSTTSLASQLPQNKSWTSSAYPPTSFYSRDFMSTLAPREGGYAIAAQMSVGPVGHDKRRSLYAENGGARTASSRAPLAKSAGMGRWSLDGGEDYGRPYSTPSAATTSSNLSLSPITSGGVDVHLSSQHFSDVQQCLQGTKPEMAALADKMDLYPSPLSQDVVTATISPVEDIAAGPISDGFAHQLHIGKDSQQHEKEAKRKEKDEKEGKKFAKKKRKGKGLSFLKRKDDQMQKSEPKSTQKLVEAAPPLSATTQAAHSSPNLNLSVSPPSSPGSGLARSKRPSRLSMPASRLFSKDTADKSNTERETVGEKKPEVKLRKSFFGTLRKKFSSHTVEKLSSFLQAPPLPNNASNIASAGKDVQSSSVETNIAEASRPRRNESHSTEFEQLSSNTVVLGLQSLASPKSMGTEENANENNSHRPICDETIFIKATDINMVAPPPTQQSLLLNPSSLSISSTPPTALAASIPGTVQQVQDVGQAENLKELPSAIRPSQSTIPPHTHSSLDCDAHSTHNPDSSPQTSLSGRHQVPQKPIEIGSSPSADDLVRDAAPVSAVDESQSRLSQILSHHSGTSANYSAFSGQSASAQSHISESDVTPITSISEGSDVEGMSIIKLQLALTIDPDQPEHVIQKGSSEKQAQAGTVGEREDSKDSDETILPSPTFHGQGLTTDVGASVLT
nr:hypothetical protein L204_05488 [Cryptococcus depauperatus CBS 7855]